MNELKRSWETKLRRNTLTLRKEWLNPYFIFKYLLIIVLLPKALQMIIYLIYTIGILTKRSFRFSISKIEMYFLSGIFIYLVSIVYYYFSFGSDIYRLFAALNSWIMWGLAIAVYSIFRTKKLDRKKIGRYMFYNIWLVFFVYLFWKVTGVTKLNLGPLEANLARIDWLSSGTTFRFVGLMDYPNSVVMLFFLAISVASSYTVKNKKNVFSLMLFCLAAFLPAVATNSRAGLILCSGCMFLTLLYFYSSNKFMYKIRKPLIFLIVTIILIYIVTHRTELKQAFVLLLNSRLSSNNTRMKLYTNSIKLTLEQSPLIGIGIKLQQGRYPLGSHSTYIGIFYKTGILGTILFIGGFISLYLKLWAKNRTAIYGKYFFFVMVLFAGMFVIEDLDGSNWIIMTYFALMGAFSVTEKGQDLESQNSIKQGNNAFEEASFSIVNKKSNG